MNWRYILDARGILKIKAESAAIAVLTLGWLVMLSIRHQGPLSIYVDFYPLYFAASRILAGETPYGSEAMAELAKAWPTSHAVTGDAYPLPFYLLIAPFALLPMPVALAAWMLCGIAGLLFLLRVYPGGDSTFRQRLIICLLFAPLFDAVWSRQPSFQYLGIIAALLYGLRDNRPLLTGASISLLVLKPQAGLLIACWGLARCAAMQRSAIKWVFTISGLLWGLSLWLFPDWIGQWLLSVYKYKSLHTLTSFLPEGLLLLPFALHLSSLAQVAILQALLFPFVCIYSEVPLLLPWMEAKGATSYILLSLSWLSILYRWGVPGANSLGLMWVALFGPLIVALAIAQGRSGSRWWRKATE